MNKRKDKIFALLSLNDLSLVNQHNILEGTQDLYEIKFENANLFEKLLFQIIFHNSNLANLTKGSSINVRDKNIKINDMTAIYSLARLQIETYVNLSYIFFLDSEYSKNLRA
jgi:hypothetical protein